MPACQCTGFSLWFHTCLPVSVLDFLFNFTHVCLSVYWTFSLISHLSACHYTELFLWFHAVCLSVYLTSLFHTVCLPMSWTPSLISCSVPVSVLDSLFNFTLPVNVLDFLNFTLSACECTGLCLISHCLSMCWTLSSVSHCLPVALSVLSLSKSALAVDWSSCPLPSHYKSFGVGLVLIPVSTFYSCWNYLELEVLSVVTSFIPFLCVCAICVV